MRRALLLSVLWRVLLGAPAGEATEPWPEGLAAAAEEHRQLLNRKQAATRDGTLASPVGVEESVQFDLQNHACHRGPAQAYREYGAPALAPSGGGKPAKVAAVGGEGRVRVRYAYRVWFRQALTLEEMFGKPWREGNDGSIEVEFRRAGRDWAPLGKRELLGGREGAGGARGAGDQQGPGGSGQHNPREGGGR